MVALKLRDWPGIGSRRSDHLRDVESASASDRHNRIGVEPGKSGSTVLHVLVGRVGLEVTECICGNSLMIERGPNLIHKVGGGEERINDDKCPMRLHGEEQLGRVQPTTASSDDGSR